jgi:hypothetical protein
MYEEILEIAISESSQYIFTYFGNICLLFYYCNLVEIDLNEKIKIK